MTHTNHEGSHGHLTSMKFLELYSMLPNHSLRRDAFVAPEGRVLLSADYAQMELRLMAHLSGDEALCAMLRDPSQDPFTLWASQWMLISTSQASTAVHKRRYAVEKGIGNR